VDRWNRFWFSPADPGTLGFCRLVLMLGAFLYYRSMDFEAFGFIPRSFWQPNWLFQRLHWVPLTPAHLVSLGLIWEIFLLLGAIGLFTRFSCAIAFGLGLYLVGLPNNTGKIDHNDAIVLWGFLVMAVARSGDAWSVDQLIRTARGRGTLAARNLVGADAERHAEYRWPLRLMQVVMALIFCIAGTTKLRTSGLSWAFPDNLRNTFLMQQYLGQPPLNWGVWIAGHQWLCMFLALTTLVMETGMPLALFSRRVRWVFVPSLFAMQLGNELLLGIKFRQFMLCYIFWVRWADVARAMRGLFWKSSATPHQTTILFDGSCGLCQRTMAVIRRLDLLQKVKVVDAMNQWPAIAGQFPALDQAQCLRVMHVIGARGQITTGFFAYRTLASVIPAGWLILPLLYVPGVPRVGQRIYQKIAERRLRNGCRMDDAARADSGTLSPLR
jgi:predicted DCC family thiol-disulfide oxidoreductase YuxK